MKFAILVFPGSNCDWDSYHAVTKVLKQKGRFVWPQTQAGVVSLTAAQLSLL